VAYASSAGYAAMAIVALIVTTAHKLDIAWRSWIPNWPEFTLAVAALASSVAALALPVGSALGWGFTAASLLLVPGALILSTRRVFSPD
jgi:hypothetical protein